MPITPRPPTKGPSAAKELADALAQGLHAAGVRTIFGLPGGGPNLDMIGSAEALGIRFVLTHGETAACIMASSFGHLTGTPGVAIVTRGPGMSSAANGLAQATLDRFPLLLITDTVSDAVRDRTAHQRFDQVAAAAPLAKSSVTLGTADPVGVVGAAARLAMAAPAGAVHLAFDPTTAGDAPLPPEPPFGSGPEAVAAARGALTSARKPVVIVGLDGARHADAVRRAVHRLGCPVLVTYEAKGVIPESWPNYAGLFTGADIEREVLSQADVILGLGLDPVEPMPGPWPYDADVVLFHSHPIDTEYFGRATLVVGSYADALDALVPAGIASEWPSDAGSTMSRDAARRLEVSTAGLNPVDVVRTTQKVVGDVLATVDAGAHMLAVMPHWRTDENDSVLISNGLATMGLALPGAIAMALARPDRRVICFVGDGGLGMVLGELETVSRLGLNVTIVVFDDATLTLIRLKQTAGQSDDAAVAYGSTDFAAVARAMGVPGRPARDLSELAAALDLPGGGPLLVDAHIDASAYRHLIKATRG